MQTSNISPRTQPAQLGDILGLHIKAAATGETTARPVPKTVSADQEHAHQHPALTVEYTIFEADAGRASPAKTFVVGPDGSPAVAISGQQPAAGRATRRRASGAAHDVLKLLAKDLESLTTRQALICAPPPAGRDEWPLATKDEARGRSDVIARTADCFPAPTGPALMGLDFDIKAWPRELVDRIEQTGGLSRVLSSVFPAIGQATYLRRASSSAGVRNTSNSRETDPNAGQHRFFVVRNGADIQRFAKALHERLILTGFGHAFVAKNGRILIRSLIDDTASADVSRLWFEGAVVLADPRLELVPEARAASIHNPNGGALNTSDLPSLSDAERPGLDEAIKTLRAGSEQEAKRIRDAYEHNAVTRLVARGIPADSAKSIVSAATDKCELIGPFEIHLDDGSMVTVDEILGNHKAYHRKTCADPHEPDYGRGSNLAIIYTDGTPHIFSHAHGGIKYQLWPSPDRWFEEIPDEPATDLGSWPEPADLFGDDDPAELTEVPEGALPDAIERWSRSEARRKGVPPAFAAAAALSVVGAAIGSSLNIRARLHDDGWTEPAALWVALVADPGSAKSPIISAAVEPLRKLDAERWTQDKSKHDAWMAASKRKGKGKGAPESLAEPKIRRNVVDDITMEMQTRIHADNPRGVLRAPDELFGLFGSLGAYKKGVEGDRSQLLRLFEGREITIDRVSFGSIRADHALMGIVAGAQPEKIRTLVRDLGSDGMLQRFLFVMNDGLDRIGIDEAPDRAALSSYARLVRGLATAEYFFPAPIRLSTDAHRVLSDAGERISRMKHMPGASAAWRGHIEKWGKFLPRIVLIFHAIESWDFFGAVDPANEISSTTAVKATRFARFMLRHSLHFYQSYFGTSDEASEAREIAGFILTKTNLTELDRRDVYSTRKKLQQNKRLLLTVMAELESAGWCEPVARDELGPKRWRVNPRIRVRFAQRAEREREARNQKRAQIMEAAELRREWIQKDNLS